MKSPTVALCSSDRHIGLLPPRRREPSKSAAAEERAATWVGLGIAEIDATVGGLIRQGRPPPVVLTALRLQLASIPKG
jgi:hypothetical protein